MGLQQTPFSTHSERKSAGTKNIDLIILNELGKGAGGKVYKALHVPTMKLVAIKVRKLYDDIQV